MAQFTDFGKKVKHRLIDLGKSQEWLVGEVRRRTGKYMDSGYLSKILTGAESGVNIIPAIREILGLEDA